MHPRKLESPRHPPDSAQQGHLGNPAPTRTATRRPPCALRCNSAPRRSGAPGHAPNTPLHIHDLEHQFWRSRERRFIDNLVRRHSDLRPTGGNRARTRKAGALSPCSRIRRSALLRGSARTMLPPAGAEPGDEAGRTAAGPDHGGSFQSRCAGQRRPRSGLIGRDRGGSREPGAVVEPAAAGVVHQDVDPAARHRQRGLGETAGRVEVGQLAPMVDVAGEYRQVAPRCTAHALHDVGCSSTRATKEVNPNAVLVGTRAQLSVMVAAGSSATPGAPIGASDRSTAGGPSGDVCCYPSERPTGTKTGTEHERAGPPDWEDRL